MSTVQAVEIPTPEMQMLRLNKQSGYNYRYRRQEDWLENYSLYRDKVKTNRLTNRQSVNLPLMKQSINTVLKDIDDMAVIYFDNLDNDKDVEILLNEYWKYTIGSQCNNMELKDIVDKKQELMFGRTFDQMQVADGKVLMTIEDPQDILVDRYTDPTDLDTARFLIHMHIFKPLSSLANNPDYDQEAVKELQEFFATQQGLLKAADNMSALQEKNRKLATMGVPDIDHPVLGETYVELSMHFVYREKDSWYNTETNKKEDANDQYMVFVECNDMKILMKKPLAVIIGKTSDDYWKNHLPYNSWAEETERQDFWSDGKADYVRPQNKIINVWYSQLVENRTLRSFGMNYFDSSLEGFSPPTIEPEPWGWVGIPLNGKQIQDVFQKVDIPDLSESLDEMKFLIDMNDRGSGATPTQQGVVNDQQITLGEVKLALNQAQGLNKGISKFYTNVWMKRAEKFLKLLEAAADKLDIVTINKEGRNTSDVYSYDVDPRKLLTNKGYRVRIWSQDEKDAKDEKNLQRLTFIAPTFAGSAKFAEIMQRKLLEFSDFKPDDINDIVNEMDEQRQAMANQPQVGPDGKPIAPAGMGPTPMPRPAPMMPGR